MTFEEFIKTNYNMGDDVWICDYRLKDDFISKPSRHIKPTKVSISNVDDLNRTIYYSDIYFKPYGKSGKLLSKVIAPYDNTGYRAYRGVAVQVFLNESECKSYYTSICKEIISDLENYKKQHYNWIDQMIEEVSNEIKECE